MTHPRKPRGALGRLLEAAKKRSGNEWPEIDRAAGVTKTTREAWINGRVGEPGLAATLRLARVLSIDCNDLVTCVLDGVLPSWVIAAELEASAGMSAKVLDSGAPSPRRRDSRRRPS